MDTEARILAAAAELFQQHGFKNVTMDDVSRQAGISKKTLYERFANKGDVVTASVSWYKQQIFDEHKTISAEASNAIEAMVRITAMIDRMCRQINPIALSELQRFYPDGYNLFRNQLLTYDVDLIKQNLEQGIEEAHYRANFDVDLLARYRVESALIALRPNMLITDDRPYQYVNQEITEHFLYGIMTIKGERLYLQYKDQYYKQANRP